MGCFFDQLPKPAVIAHRGASAHAPENTFAAFELAISLNADAIELDVKLTSDGRVVVFHDLSLQRTTNGAGKVHRKTLSELKTFDAGTAFDRSYQGQQIPTLDETLETFGKRTYFNIELKNLVQPFDDLPQKVVRIIKDHGLESRILISSFNPIALLKTNRILPSLPIGLLIKYPQRTVLGSKPLTTIIPHQSVHIPAKALSKDIVRTIHKTDRKVFAYTINVPKTIQEMLAWDVDGIFTDDPRLARQTLGRVD